MVLLYKKLFQNVARMGSEKGLTVLLLDLFRLLM